MLDRTNVLLPELLEEHFRCLLPKLKVSPRVAAEGQ
jgi:hypothetical protein